jgi:NAD(P)-dependent dehydrogenase (short-subunit alcohol dehydrogenase family)
MKTVLVTGASGGIGKSICEVFLENGYKVIGVDCCETSGLPYDVIHFDISKLRKADSLCDEFFLLVETLTEGSLDALVNNAAVQIVKPVEQLTTDDWDITLDTNLLSPFWLVQRFLPLLRKARGSVVNISSIHATQTKKGFAAYSTSKGALVSLTRALSLDLAPEIRVNAVLPAATDTLMLREGFKDNPGGLQELGSYHPMGRIAETKEVADLVFFLAGKKAAFITGAAINIDGGIGSCLHDPA